jgi:hypothetical protein
VPTGQVLLSMDEESVNALVTGLEALLVALREATEPVPRKLVLAPLPVRPTSGLGGTQTG